MSKQIDLTKKLSKFDREYLEARGMTAQLDQNAAHLMGGGLQDAEAEKLEPAGAEDDAPKHAKGKTEDKS